VAPESLRIVNWFSRDHQIVQIPVLPLPTGLAEMTHGVYCDEFAEYQLKGHSGAPAAGRLSALQRSGHGLRPQRPGAAGGHPRRPHFRPRCLTEDYENGFRLHALGCRQIFVPLRLPASAPVATPRVFSRAGCAPPSANAAVGWPESCCKAGQQPWLARPARASCILLARPQGSGGEPAFAFANLLFLCWLAGWRGVSGVRHGRPICVLRL